MTQEQTLVPKRRLDHRIMNFFLAMIARLTFRMYAHWKIIGLENVPKTGGVLVAANHSSYLDPILIWASSYGYRSGWGIGRDTLWNNKIAGYLLDCIGVFPIKRGAADRTALRRTLELLAQGDAVALFPEGTRTRDGLLNPAQPGIALLAMKSGVPIVPVAILGTFEMWPAGQKKLKRGPLTLAYGQPLRFGPETRREEIPVRVMEAIAALMTANGRPTEPPAPNRAPLTEEG